MRRNVLFLPRLRFGPEHLLLPLVTSPRICDGQLLDYFSRTDLT